jgi:hypothetical protein
MSPITAFFIGIFGVGAVGVASVTTVVLYGLSIVKNNAEVITSIAEETIKDLPDLIERAPALVDAIGGRRVPGYAEKVDIELNFVLDKRSGSVRPVMSITNTGNEVVTMLAVRVAALGKENIPLHEWTEVVATPLSIDDHWRGPLYPGSTRYVRLSGRWRGLPADMVDKITGAVEISDIRLWEESSAF